MLILKRGVGWERAYWFLQLKLHTWEWMRSKGNIH